jgi:hypothetical protein
LHNTTTIPHLLLLARPAAIRPLLLIILPQAEDTLSLSWYSTVLFGMQWKESIEIGTEGLS